MLDERATDFHNKKTCEPTWTISDPAWTAYNVIMTILLSVNIGSIIYVLKFFKHRPFQPV
jgi:hypothetical protein